VAHRDLGLGTVLAASSPRQLDDPHPERPEPQLGVAHEVEQLAHRGGARVQRRDLWAAAAVGANNAAGYQLASGRPVMPLGGFNGSDPSPTLAQFQAYVDQGRIHYFLGGAGFQAQGGSREAQQIAAWVAENFTATTVDGVTVYDLTG